MAKKERKTVIKYDLNSTKSAISLLVNLASASTKIKSITVKQEGGSEFPLRPSLHIILQAKIGSCKSTILREVGKQSCFRCGKRPRYATLRGI